MLTGMQIQNFKAWKDAKVVRLALLTVIFGTNSSGKSSLGDLLLALKQTVQLADRKRASDRCGSRPGGSTNGRARPRRMSERWANIPHVSSAPDG